MATLTVSLSEKLELNGKNVGGEQRFSIASVTQAYQRIVTCPANNDTTVAAFQTAVHTADNAIDLEDTKYIRVTNIDEANEVVLSLQISNNENGTADGSTSILLAAGQSYVMGLSTKALLATAPLPPLSLIPPCTTWRASSLTLKPTTSASRYL